MEVLKGRFEQAGKQKSVNLNIAQLRLSGPMNKKIKRIKRNIKNTETCRTPSHQHLQKAIPLEKRTKGPNTIFEDLMSKTFPNLMKKY